MKFPPWLEAESNRLATLLERKQLPHALLMHGPIGVGRRSLATWLALRLLGEGAAIPDFIQNHIEQSDEEAASTHPDFRLIEPEEGKKTIAIDQIRELIEALSLTSHQGGAKVVVISPAQAMTKEAANCLLKTLEEPTDNSYLILVVESLSRLPSTVISRCHRIRVALPDHQIAASWLNSIDPAVNWPVVLKLSAGAPLAALALQQTGFVALAEKLEQDLAALSQGNESAARVAKRWVKYDQEPCLRWLFYKLSAEIRAQYERCADESIEKPVPHRLQKSDETLNMESSFAALVRIGEMRHSQGSGLNMELHLTDVLTRWYPDSVASRR
jgi:DNA polymerase III subunit delta'